MCFFRWNFYLEKQDFCFFAININILDNLLFSTFLDWSAGFIYSPFSRSCGSLIIHLLIVTIPQLTASLVSVL